MRPLQGRIAFLQFITTDMSSLRDEFLCKSLLHTYNIIHEEIINEKNSGLEAYLFPLFLLASDCIGCEAARVKLQWV